MLGQVIQVQCLETRHPGSLSLGQCSVVKTLGTVFGLVQYKTWAGLMGWAGGLIAIVTNDQTAARTDGGGGYQ